MAAEKKERSVVMFLGAGFSYDADFPLVREFGRHEGAKQDALMGHAQAKRESEEYRLAAPMLVEAAETFRAFRDVCRRAHTVSDDDADNLETVFCIAEAMREAGFEHVTLDGQPCSLAYVIRNIQLWLWKVYQRLPLFGQQVGDRATPIYERLFGVIRDLGIAGQISVATMNYDILFEYLAWKYGIECSYPFSHARPIEAGIHTDFEPNTYVGINKPHVPLYSSTGERIYLSTDPDYPPTSPDVNVAFLDNRPKLSESLLVSKLHGSVNFFQNPQAEDPEALYVAADLAGAGDRIGRSPIPTERPAILAVDAIWSIHSRYGDSFTPAIIPPTYAKLTGAKWLRSVWSEAVIALREAEKVVFVGYSLPESDGFIRAMINGAMLQRSMEPKVYVIDPDEGTHDKFKNLFRSLYTNIGTLALADVTSDTWKRILSKE